MNCMNDTEAWFALTLPLEKETSVSINHRNLQLLTAKMFKVSEGEYPKNESKVFPEKQR